MVKGAIGLLILVVAGLAVYCVVTITGLQGDVRDARANVASLRAQDHTLAAKVATLEHPSTGDWASATDLSDLTSRVDTLEGSVKGATTTSTQLKNCLPEVQAELDSLGVSGGYPVVEQQVSRVCQAVVYGSGPSDGE